MEKLYIMADFAGAYAWCDDECIGDGDIFDVDGGISMELKRDFSEWINNFDSCLNNTNFDWDRFNNIGIQLTRRLAIEIGNRFQIEYHYPFEDPNRKNIIKINCK
jgi:hypothetical protein